MMITQDRGEPAKDALNWRVSLPPVAILLSAVALFVWMAPRGFDFTDEAYYFLTYLHWRDFSGSISFFGAYLELPFLLLGQSVTGMRILGLLLLLACGAFFSREALAYWARRDGAEQNTPWAFVIVGMAASMFYYSHLSTLRAPSYNLLALCSMLVATGLLLRLLERSAVVSHARITMFLYGAAVGVCGLSKVTSGVLLVVGHVFFLALAHRDWRLRHLTEFLAFSLAGVFMNVVVLQWTHPQWLDMLLKGVATQGAIGSHGPLDLAGGLWSNILEMLPQLLPLAVVAEGGVVWLIKWVGPASSAGISALVTAIVGGCALGLILGSPHWWLPLLALTTLLLWSVEFFCCKQKKSKRDGAIDFTLMALLIAMPLAYSFGTNMSVLDHSQMAAVFPVMAIALRLNRLARLGILRQPALVVCLTALCLPPLALQVRAATDVDYTYRQLSALGEQTIPVQLGPVGTTLLVDAETRKSLNAVIDAARAAGFVTGEAILDFTGDGPGLVYALGGRPLGRAWLLGGLPGSSAVAANMIASLPEETLRSAWLLSSDNNPRAIKAWTQMLEARVGPGTHALVATVTIRAPYHWGERGPDRLTVHIWEPLRR